MDAESDFVAGDSLDPLFRAAVERSRTSATVDIDGLYRQHRSRLIGLAAAITLDSAIAEEVVQDAFVGLHRHRGHVDNPEHYLQRSVVNLCLSVLRKRRIVARYPRVPAAPASSPEIDETWAAVVRLPAKQRSVVVLRFWQDMTIEAIAETLGWPAGSVKSTLHRALKHLKEQLT